MDSNPTDPSPTTEPGAPAGGRRSVSVGRGLLVLLGAPALAVALFFLAINTIPPLRRAFGAHGSCDNGQWGGGP